MPPTGPKLLELPSPGHYSVPTAVALLDLFLPEGTQKGCIRLDLGNGRRLDVLLSDHCLAQLSRALAPLVNPPVE